MLGLDFGFGVGVFSYTLVSEYCWQLAKNETSSLGCFFSILCFIEMPSGDTKAL